MSTSRHGKSGGFKRILENRKRRIAFRLRERVWSPQDRPMFSAGNVHYELAERVRGLGTGGIGAMQALARRSGLIEAIDRRLHLLKVHLPYHESDHVLNIAYNALCGGSCLEDLELRRSDEAYLDALGAQRIPDPTTAGDFCRRFAVADVEILQDAINAARVGVWRRQPTAFFDEATIDVDGALAPTDGECKQGISLAYDGTWGYHPLIVSLANTQEPLYLCNRSGNRPSHEGAAAYLDRAIALCRRAGFQRVRLRGDTDFSQTAHLDRWDSGGSPRVVGVSSRVSGGSSPVSGGSPRVVGASSRITGGSSPVIRVRSHVIGASTRISGASLRVIRGSSRVIRASLRVVGGRTRAEV